MNYYHDPGLNSKYVPGNYGRRVRSVNDMNNQARFSSNSSYRIGYQSPPPNYPQGQQAYLNNYHPHPLHKGNGCSTCGRYV